MGCALITGKSLQHLEPRYSSFAWSKAASIPLGEWINSNVSAKALGVPTDMDLTSKKGRLQPWCMQGRNFQAMLPAPIATDILDIRYAYDQLLIRNTITLEDLRVNLPESYRYSTKPHSNTLPYLDTANVICMREDTAVVQLVLLDSKSEFLLIDMQTATILGSYSEYAKDYPYLYECYIAPDKTQFIIKPNLLYSLKYNLNSVEDCVKLLGPSVCRKTYHMSSNRKRIMRNYDIISSHFNKQAIDLHFAFDPRYKWTRLAVGNLLKRGQNEIGIYCLRTSQILWKNKTPPYQRIQNITFSPDGTFVAALYVCFILGTNTFPRKYECLSVIVYASDNLKALRRLPIHGLISVVSWAPETMFPIFSGYGHHILLGSGNGQVMDGIEVYHTAKTFNLQHLCRLTLLSHMTRDAIENLNIDKSLKDYILFKPYMQ